jgi:hypothetical protein
MMLIGKYRKETMFGRQNENIEETEDKKSD